MTKNAGIKWKENQRFEIYADKLVPAKTQPTQASRVMTGMDDNNAIPELTEFIKTTKEDYPADQYFLIFWDHGSGPKDGYGSDERSTSENPESIKAWSIAPTMEEAGVDGDNLFALINYDACLMGNLETALAWSSYARYYLGSEELEPGCGDNYEPWVRILCEDAENIDFADETKANEETEKIGRQDVESFYEWYKDKDNATKSFIKLSETEAVAGALRDYAKICSRLFSLNPMNTYKGMKLVRTWTQDFGGRECGIMDISDFVSCFNSNYATAISMEWYGDSGIIAAVEEAKKAGDVLTEAEEKAVLLHKETVQYEEFPVGGLTAYFPYLHADEYIGDYLTGYRDVKETDTLNDYRTFIGTFAAIQAAGRTVAKNNVQKSEVEKAFSDALNNYGLPDLYSGSLKTVPDELMNHSLHNESMKIYKRTEDGQDKYYYKRRDFELVDDVYQGPAVKIDSTDHYLGYLPGGPYNELEGAWEQELVNYGEQQWFGFDNGNGQYIPVAIYAINSGYEDPDERLKPGNPFRAETTMEIPVLYEGGLHMLDVKFAANSNDGTVKGMWPFNLDSRVYSRYINAKDFNGKEITLLADVPNVLAGEDGAVFDKDNMEASALGTITFNQNTTKLKRGIDKTNMTLGADMTMDYYMLDLFDSLYPFASFDETVRVSLKAGNTRKAKGSTMTTEDVGLSFEAEDGTEYGDSELEDMSYYYKAENGDEKELLEIDGTFYAKTDDDLQEDAEASGALTEAAEEPAGDDATGVPEGYSEFKLDRDTEILIKQNDIKIDNLKSLDGADIDLQKYFTLEPGTTSVTIKVASEESEQFTDKSKETARRALVYPIDPVTYTGKNLLTTQSKGSGSKDIELVLYSEDGQTQLEEGKDYTVSYKNNKNAADMNDKKAPTLTINGKGLYAGMKYIAVFTIEKASFSETILSFDRSYAPLSNKGITLKTTVVTQNGVKVPANQCKIHYYRADGTEVTVQELQQLYTTATEVIPLTVKAEAVENAKNFVPGSIAEKYQQKFSIYAVPKSKGTLSVALKTNKVSADLGKSAYDFMVEQFKSAKIGKANFTVKDLEYHGLFTDSKFMKPQSSDKLDTAGTYYLAVSLNPGKQKEYGNYKTIAIKVIVTKPK